MDIHIFNIPNILTHRYSVRIQVPTVLSKNGIYEEINLVLHISRYYINCLENWPPAAAAAAAAGGGRRRRDGGWASMRQPNRRYYKK